MKNRTFSFLLAASTVATALSAYLAYDTGLYFWAEMTVVFFFIFLVVISRVFRRCFVCHRYGAINSCYRCGALLCMAHSYRQMTGDLCPDHIYPADRDPPSTP